MTHIGNVDLSRTAWGRTSEITCTWASELLTAAVWASGMASARRAGVAESRLGLSIFSDVYEAPHQVLVAERGDRVLGLVPGRIFHDATSLHPSKSQSTSIHHTNKPAINRTITFDIPFGSSNTSANKTSPAARLLVLARFAMRVGRKLTLSHEIFQVVPLDVVG